MIEATIVEIGYGVNRNAMKALVGSRCSSSMCQEKRFMKGWHKAIIDFVIEPRKNSRMRKELYQGKFLLAVRLENMVVDEYEID